MNVKRKLTSDTFLWNVMLWSQFEEWTQVSLFIVFVSIAQINTLFLSFCQSLLLRRPSGYFSHCLSFCLSVDDRFPPDATVEFIFSNGPEKMKGEHNKLIVCHCILQNIWCIFVFAFLCCVISKCLFFQGREYRKNDASIKVDYNTSDPVVRWDSYENFNLHHQDSMESKKCACTHTLTHTHRCKKDA